MANLGGGVEAHARFNQYGYCANSSLVLTTDSRPRDTHEPTGKPESLWGKIDPKLFGDRAYRGKPPELEEKLKKKDSKRRRILDGGDTTGSVLANDNNEALDDDIGVAVEFEEDEFEEDEEEDNDYEQVQEESEDEDEDGQELSRIR